MMQKNNSEFTTKVLRFFKLIQQN